MKGEGLKIVISGPSGSGKGTIVQELLKQGDYKLSISATTRKQRTGEIEGKHYFFKSKQEFDSMIEKDEMLEYAKFCNNYYGTPKEYVDNTIKLGHDIILEIEVQGALQVKKKYNEAVFIFIMTPTFKELKNRLVSRNTESMDIINNRLTRACEELSLFKEYDYIVINDNLEDAIREINTIVAAEKLKSGRYENFIKNVLANQEA
ncbi:MAG: guanylate kinase [Epulopiscium sp. Nuni2H_MBin003]|nr:MAG: guanylate kinase [Epulopiscium sp. Nuni2H_MBin003]